MLWFWLLGRCELVGLLLLGITFLHRQNNLFHLILLNRFTFSLLLDHFLTFLVLFRFQLNIQIELLSQISHLLHIRLLYFLLVDPINVLNGGITIQPPQFIILIEPILDHMLCSNLPHLFRNLAPSQPMHSDQIKDPDVFFSGPFALLYYRIEMVEPLLPAMIDIPEVGGVRSEEQLKGNTTPVYFPLLQVLPHDLIE